MTKIQVPAGMLEAAMRSRMSGPGLVGPWSEGMCSQVLEAALQWLSEHPIVPTDEQHKDIIAEWRSECREDQGYKAFVEEWQRRMFLAEPEIPEEIRDLLCTDPCCSAHHKQVQDVILEAFRRGRSKGRGRDERVSTDLPAS